MVFESDSLSDILASSVIIDNLRPVPCHRTVIDTVQLADVPDLSAEEPLLSGTDDLTNGDYFSIYPNPNARDMLTVEWGAVAVAEGRLMAYDAVGRLCAQWLVPAGLAGQTIDIAALPAGVYALTLERGGGTVARAKLVVVPRR